MLETKSDDDDQAVIEEYEKSADDRRRRFWEMHDSVFGSHCDDWY